MARTAGKFKPISSPLATEAAIRHLLSIGKTRKAVCQELNITARQLRLFLDGKLKPYEAPQQPQTA